MQLLAYFDETTSRAVHARRAYLSQSIREQTQSIVQYGILKGFRVPHSAWAEIISSSYILGTYEVAVCAILDFLKGREKALVDLGGADGLFGVGLVTVGAFSRSLIFETNPKAQQAILDLARANAVEDRVAVFGEAGADLVEQIAKQEVDPQECVVLCDIEGAEFGLFTDDVLCGLQKSHVIIELHDFLLSDPAQREGAIADLVRRAERYFDVCEVKDGLRDIRSIPLLRNWSDWDSWLLCVEARYRMMSWLWLRPKGFAIFTPSAIDNLVIDYQRRIFADRPAPQPTNSAAA